jgi:hypothetical protein
MELVLAVISSLTAVSAWHYLLQLHGRNMDPTKKQKLGDINERMIMIRT